MSDKVYASDITKALARRHTQDFFLTEVKDGPTVFGGHMRMDAVAIAKSWTKPCIHGYEVKVSRSDWLADQKWQYYLPMCHRFTIATASGVVKDGEVPDGIGWMEYTGNGGFRTKKKPLHRSIEPDPNMLLYIIMNRIDPDRVPFYSDKEALIRDYLEGKKSARELGYRFSRKISDLLYESESIKERMKRMQEEQAEEHSLIDEIAKIVVSHGGSAWRHGLPRAIDGLLRGETPNEAGKIVQRLKADVDRLQLLVGQVKL